MRKRARQHWRFTAFLFTVGIAEFILVAFYLSVSSVRPPSLLKPRHDLGAFGIQPHHSKVEIKQLTFRELFKPDSGIEKRLPKLLHDFFKETESAAFSSSELVGLLNLEVSQVKQFTLKNDVIVIYINPHATLSDQGIKSIAIKKELLASELRDENKTSRGNVPATNSDYEIVSQPKPGNAVRPQEKMLALTFDDGPDANTHALLDALDKYEANATFFVLGQKVAGGVDVLQRMVREGHEIGNHSWSHPDLRRLAPPQILSQIVDTQNAIRNATGVAPAQMRPPYGAINPVVQQIIQGQGLALAMWSIDTNDWRDRDPELLYQRIMSSAADGKVILLHDIHPDSVQAAIRAIPDLKAQGYQLVTTSQRNQYR